MHFTIKLEIIDINDPSIQLNLRTISSVKSLSMEFNAVNSVKLISKSSGIISVQRLSWILLKTISSNTIENTNIIQKTFNIFSKLLKSFNNKPAINPKILWRNLTNRKTPEKLPKLLEQKLHKNQSIKKLVEPSKIWIQTNRGQN